MPQFTPSTWSTGRFIILLGYVSLLAFPAFYWFDSDHFSHSDWHIHARFHMLWKTMMMMLLGAVGAWVVSKKWESGTARQIARWVPVGVWATHFLSHFLMLLLFEENAFPHHQEAFWGISGADLAVGFTLILFIIGAMLDQHAERHFSTTTSRETISLSS